MDTLTARSLVIAAPYHVGIAREAVPAPQAGQVLVESQVSAISAGTELLFYRGLAPTDLPVDANLGSLGQELPQYPLRYGYACVGRVTKLGAGVDEGWLHRRVFAFHPHASHFCADPTSLLIAPATLPAETCALLPNMETAVNFVMDGRPMLGEHVTVVGLGVVGLLTIAVLARFPLASLTAIDPLPQRRALALQFGAHRALAPHESPAHTESDLTYEVSGNPAALDTAIACTGYTGRIVVGSWYGQKQAPVALGGAFHRSRIRLQSSQVSTIDPVHAGRWNKDRRFAVAWSLLAALDTAPLITHRIPIEEAQRAYAILDKESDRALQVILTYIPIEDLSSR
jgi:2-desacetyl-2-hydroxyethyl bacteriochlorophyllide A dehydrogenase